MKRLLWVVCVVGLSTLWAQKEGDAAKGKEVFEGQPCAACHSIDSDEAKAGPSLKGVFKRDKMKNGTKITEESVKKIIKEGSDKGMPATELPDEDLNNLVAFLKTL